MNFKLLSLIALLGLSLNLCAMDTTSTSTSSSDDSYSSDSSSWGWGDSSTYSGCKGEQQDESFWDKAKR